MNSDWSLKDLFTNRVIPIKKALLTIGRNPNADISTISQVVSKNHAELLLLADGNLCLEDRESSNGTFINNIKITPKVRKTLQHNDEVSFGISRLEANKPQNKKISYLLFRVQKHDSVIIIEDTPPNSPQSLHQEDDDMPSVNKEQVGSMGTDSLPTCSGIKHRSVEPLKRKSRDSNAEMLPTTVDSTDLNKLHGIKVEEYHLDKMDIDLVKIESVNCEVIADKGTTAESNNGMGDNHRNAVTVEVPQSENDLDIKIRSRRSSSRSVASSVSADENNRIIDSIKTEDHANLVNKTEGSLSVKEEPVDFSVVDNYIVITDDEDDEPFACSQLMKMCEIKTEMKIEEESTQIRGIINAFEDLNYKDDLMRSSPQLIELDNFYEDSEDLLNQLLTQQDPWAGEPIGPLPRSDSSDKINEDEVSNIPKQSTDLSGNRDESCSEIITKLKEKSYSKHVKPPIIEAPPMSKAKSKKEPSKRKINERLSMDSEKKSRLHKSSSTNSKDNREYSNKLDKNKKQEIKKARNELLKQLSSKTNNVNKATDSHDAKVINSATKVKSSDKSNRGKFLLAETAASPKRKSTEKKSPSASAFKAVKLTVRENSPEKQNDCFIKPSMNYKRPERSKKKDSVTNSIESNTDSVRLESPQPSTSYAASDVVKTGINPKKPVAPIKKDSSFKDNQFLKPSTSYTRPVERKKIGGVPKKCSINGYIPDEFMLSQAFIDDSAINISVHEPSKSCSLRKSSKTNDLKKMATILNNAIQSSVIIKKLVRWSTEWLIEQKSINKSPPVSDPVIKMPDNFSCYSDYVKIVSNLTLLEMWKTVYSDWSNRQTQMPCFQVEIVHKRAVRDLSFMDCKLSGNLNIDTLPKLHYLVLVEMSLKHESKKRCLQKYFALVTKRDLHFNKHPKTGAISHTLEFTLATKLDGKELQHNVILMSVLSNISHFVDIIKNIKSLEKSPLMHRILQPTLDNFRYDFKDVSLLKVGRVRQLNPIQESIVKEAVQVCTSSQPQLYLIKGPPGTGKSTVLVNIILQLILGNFEPKPRILLTAPSNAAVDELIQKLLSVKQDLDVNNRKRIKIVRIGHESTMHPVVRQYSLMEHTKREIMGTVLKQYPDICAEYDHLSKRSKYLNLERHKLQDKKMDTSEIETELKQLKHDLNIDYFLRKNLKDYSFRLKTVKNTVMMSSNIVCATLNSSVRWTADIVKNAPSESPFFFTCCIVDEAAQCSEVEGLAPFQLGIDRLVLVGDPQQLPATVQSLEAKTFGYGKSLFTRLANNFPTNEVTPVRTLNVQYRMPLEVLRFPNSRFYDGKLMTNHVIRNKIKPVITPYLVFNLDVEAEEDNEYHNNSEIIFVTELIRLLISTISSDVNYSIGVITPYNIQKEALRKKLPMHRPNNVTIDVNTVDSFQGQEKDIIIISYVRQTPNNFLRDEQRLNVALTRAKQALFVVGTYDLFKHCSILYDLREEAKEYKLCRNIKNLRNYFAYMKKDIFEDFR